MPTLSSLFQAPTKPPHPLISLIRSSTSSPPQLKQIHSHLLRLLPFHLPLPTSAVVLTTLLRALSDASLPLPALSLLPLMLRLQLRPGRLALPFALRSAAALVSLPSLLSLHSFTLKLALDLDPFVRSTLADSYSKLNLPSLSLQLLHSAPQWHKSSNPLLWNVALHSCCKSGNMGDARSLFDEMPERTLASWNGLIHGFIKNNDFDSAIDFFDKMPERNVVSWTTMVSGFAQSGDGEMAVKMFDRMLEAGVRPNVLTLTSVLSACARTGALDAGVRMHDYAAKNGFRVDGPVGTALVDMYAKCGKIEVARKVFDGMKKRDALAWTAMTMGWAVHGQWEEAMRCFEEMRMEPDEGMFLAVLMACSHSGKVEEGLAVFDRMRVEYKIEPTMKHYTCIVDLLGRAGRLEEAHELLKSMPGEPDFVLWGALFTACRAHKNVPLAELAAEKLLRLKPIHSGGYVFLSNVYTGAGRWDDAERVRTRMKDKSVAKSPGWSYIEVCGRSEEIYEH